MEEERSHKKRQLRGILRFTIGVGMGDGRSKFGVVVWWLGLVSWLGGGLRGEKRKETSVKNRGLGKMGTPRTFVPHHCGTDQKGNYWYVPCFDKRTQERARDREPKRTDGVREGEL